MSEISIKYNKPNKMLEYVLNELLIYDSNFYQPVLIWYVWLTMHHILRLTMHTSFDHFVYTIYVCLTIHMPVWPIMHAKDENCILGICVRRRKRKVWLTIHIKQNTMHIYISCMTYNAHWSETYNAYPDKPQQCIPCIIYTLK